LSKALGAERLATLHLVTGALSDDVAEFAGRVTDLSRRAELHLRSGDRKILVDDLVDLLSLVLGNANDNVGRLEDNQREHFMHRLELLEERYTWSARRSTQLTYFFWMLIGLGALVVVASLTGVGLLVADVTGFKLTTYVSTFVAGGLGAIVSVMARMSTVRFDLAPELGRPWLRLLGGIRPFIGGIFGVLSYFALTSDLLAVRLVSGGQRFYAFCVIAFIFGFSERIAPDMLVSTVRRHLGHADNSQSPSHPQTPEQLPLN
jgi:hypothetical protein